LGLGQSIARTVKDELVNAIRSLHEMPERFPFLDAQLVPVDKYHKMCVGSCLSSLGRYS
jgi:hypothetical protein